MIGEIRFKGDYKMTRYDDMNLDRHLGRIISSHPRLSISEYIKDYRLKKIGNEYSVQSRMFLSDKWRDVMSFDSKHKDIINYLRDSRKKESILK